MSSHFRPFAIVAVIGLVGSAQAGSPEKDAPADLRKRVVDWLHAANEYEFVGVLEFKKQMFLPPDANQVVEANDWGQRVEEEISKVTAKTETTPEDIRIEGKDGEFLISQMREAEAFFRHWSSNRVSVAQHWRVVYFSPDDIRVEFASSSAALPITSSLPMVHIDARSAGDAWSWVGLVRPNMTSRSPIQYDRGGRFVRQALSEMRTLLLSRFDGLDERCLVSVTTEGDRVLARFNFAPGNDRPDEKVTLAFESKDGTLRLRSSVSQNGERYVRYTYGDFRVVDGREIPFLTTFANGPNEEQSLAIKDVRYSTVELYRIARLEYGINSTFERLLEKPAGVPEESKSYEEISPRNYSPFLSTSMASQASQPGR